MSEVCAVRLRIVGRVQGVWFRGWTAKRAAALGVDGWVRNCMDGSVEALVVGAPQAVAKMIALCHEGPPAAVVHEVIQQEISPVPEIGPGFDQKPTR